MPLRMQTFDSNGPDVRIRGSAYQVHEKYLQLARDANSSGDRIMAENYLQHAEHYYRIIAAVQEQQGNGDPNRRRPEGGYGQDYRGGGEEMGGDGEDYQSEDGGEGPQPRGDSGYRGNDPYYRQQSGDNQYRQQSEGQPRNGYDAPERIPADAGQRPQPDMPPAGEGRRRNFEQRRPQGEGAGDEPRPRQNQERQNPERQNLERQGDYRQSWPEERRQTAEPQRDEPQRDEAEIQPRLHLNGHSEPAPRAEAAPEPAAPVRRPGRPSRRSAAAAVEPPSEPEPTSES